MKWSPAEIEGLTPILREVMDGFEFLEGDSLLVLCSGEGELAFRLAEANPDIYITGAELDAALVDAARVAIGRHTIGHVQFSPTEKNQLPFYENAFNHLVSEFIVFPSPSPTKVGQREMARVLCPGGDMVVTDVIVSGPLPAETRVELRKIGLDYLCEGSMDDFRGWMDAAGLCDVELKDLSEVVRPLWEARAKADQNPEHQKAYSLLLEESPVSLGKGLFYIMVRGVKPDG